jgi:hypothetical protein
MTFSGGKPRYAHDFFIVLPHEALYDSSRATSHLDAGKWSLYGMILKKDPRPGHGLHSDLA